MNIQDTHPTIENIHINMFREAGPLRRFRLACSLFKSRMGLPKNAIHQANPDLSLSELKLKILSLCYGEGLETRLKITIYLRRGNWTQLMTF